MYFNIYVCDFQKPLLQCHVISEIILIYTDLLLKKLHCQYYKQLCCLIFFVKSVIKCFHWLFDE